MVKKRFKIFCTEWKRWIEKNTLSPNSRTQRNTTNQMSNKFRMNKKSIFLKHFYSTPRLKEFTTNITMAMSLDGFKKGLDKLVADRCINQQAWCSKRTSTSRGSKTSTICWQFKENSWLQCKTGHSTRRTTHLIQQYTTWVPNMTMLLTSKHVKSTATMLTELFRNRLNQFGGNLPGSSCLKVIWLHIVAPSLR